MEKEKNAIRTSPVQELKNRIKELKGKLPHRWRSILIRNYPEYDSMAGATLVSNVMTYRSTDMKLTGILEEISAGSLK